MRVREHVAKVAELRRKIREAGESVSDWELRDLWDGAQFELGNVRLFGDLVVSAFFEGEKPREREAKRSAYANAVVSGEAERYRVWLEERRHDDPPLAPFHWEIEFPEVFERKNPGFDAIVGNPPFAGKNTVAGGNAVGYPDWLQQVHEESHGNADLVAHFYRRAFDLIRSGGAFGLIATNTIAQGDTRGTGLRWICRHGGEIYSARKRVKWPGQAAVVVSVLHVAKGAFPGPRRLDERDVETITAFLFHRGGHDDPARLAANAGKSFVGSYVLGMGFTFDDTDTKGVATPLAEMRRLIEKDPRNQDVIFPYIGGRGGEHEPDARPPPLRHQLRRAERGGMPAALAGPGGDRRGEGEAGADEEQPRGPQAVLVAVRRDDAGPVRRHRGAGAGAGDLAGHVPRSIRLSSRAHSLLARLKRLPPPHPRRLLRPPVPPPRDLGALLRLLAGGSTPLHPLRDCFETFPFPESWETDPALEAAGRAYYDFRAALMVRNDEGLTKTYNRFHDPTSAIRRS
jgi:hypothetical protein